MTVVNSNKKSAFDSFKLWLASKAPLLFVFFLIAVLIVVFFWSRVVITIGSGEAGVLFRRFGGTEIENIYGEGLHLFNPLDTVYIYNTRKQIAFHEFDVISNKGLSVTLSLAIRYRPEYELLGILHQRIGPNFLQSVIIPQIESVMRKQLGSYSAEQIYTNEEGLLTNAILAALDEVGRNYVEVDDIIIRSIVLPNQIVHAIEKKLQQEEHMKSYEFRIETAKKEAERIEIEAKGIKTHHEIVNASLTEAILRHQGIKATESLAKSSNAKVVVIGSGKDGLPIILNTDSTAEPKKDNVEINNKPSQSKTPPQPSSGEVSAVTHD